MQLEIVMVNYWFNTFKHLNSFDIVSYQDMIDLYLKNQSLLEQSGKEKLGGENERPVNSDVEEVDHEGFWLGYNPRYYNINPYGDKVTQAKADVVSMDMVGLNKSWKDFIYLEIPSWLFNKYQTAVHSNRDVTYFREFMTEVDTTDLSRDVVLNLVDEYDTKYKNVGKYIDYFGDWADPAWRLDLDVGQYISIKENGLIYPIMFNSRTHAFSRGTHRALFLAHTKSNVPFILQHPKNKRKWEVELAENFDEKNITMRINLDKKSLKFYREGKKLV
jgi:hypothetical protein